MLAIIPARGGSKGLPNKNIKTLKGKPLIAHTIEHALKAKNVSRVIVSTDDDKIAEIALQYGAEIPFMRPKHLASDTALAIDYFSYTIEKIQQTENTKISDFIILQPTSPLRTNKDIDIAIKLFYKKNADSVISYTEEAHPLKWHKYINDDFSITDIFNIELSNRQEIKKTYYPNGAIYIFKYKIILKKTYYTNKSFAYIMPRNRSLDIDTIEDFKYAEYLST